MSIVADPPRLPEKSLRKPADIPRFASNARLIRDESKRMLRFIQYAEIADENKMKTTRRAIPVFYPHPIALLRKAL
jgi:hypothetical protein